MCGIAGWFTSIDRPLVDASHDLALKRMHRALRHRGPDGEGSWHDPAKVAAMLHTRLAIIDLSAAGRQPMQSSDGRFNIVFNGEIYNFRELRRELESRHTSFSTNTDTEVLLKLYEQYGAASVEMLRGMFAFAIWDAHKRCAFLARDPFGIKPLYYAETNGQLLFASELRVLVASGTISENLNARSLEGYFEAGAVPEPETLLEGVLMLPAGHTLKWAEGRSRLEEYWAIEFPQPTVALTKDATPIARAALEDSLRAHFVSDVPVGIFLSGGIDSTAILALARSTGQLGELRTFSVAVDDAELNEAPAAEQTARHFGTQHTTLRLDAARAADFLPIYLQAMDVPSIDGFNTWVVSWLARSEGMKVVLSGLGGDEIFGGYPSFVRVPQLQKMAGALGWTGRLGRAGGWLLERHARTSRWQRLGNLIHGPANLGSAYRAFRGVFSPRQARRLAAHFSGASEASLERVGENDHSNIPKHPGDGISYLELSRYMRNQLLRDSDVMSMAHGLELRVPLVDRNLFETLATVAPAIRLAGKRLLLEAVPEIPVAIARAPKRGFRFPYHKWLASGLGDLFRASTISLPVDANEWYQRWSIFMFCRWHERLIGASKL